MAKTKPALAMVGRFATILGMVCLVLAAANYSNHFFDSQPSEAYRIIVIAVLGAIITLAIKIKINEVAVLIVSVIVVLTIQLVPVSLMLFTDHAILYLYGAVFVTGGLLGYCLKETSPAQAVIGIIAIAILYSFLSSAISFTLAATSVLVGYALYFKRPLTRIGALAVVPFVFFIQGPEKHKTQGQFEDRVITEIESDYGKISFTRWNNNTTLYIGKKKQLSSADAYLYYEPMILPALSLIKSEEPTVLIIGGDLGLSANQVLRSSNAKIVIVPLDTVLSRFAKIDKDMANLNNLSFENSNVNMSLGYDPFEYLLNSSTHFDLIIIDTPDPTNIELNQYFTIEFYELCKTRLAKDGILVTQAGSPYYAYRAFVSIDRTMQHAGFETLALHNQILTLGEWGWLIGSPNLKRSEIINRIGNHNFDNSQTKWLNNEAVDLITSFGKPMVFPDSIALNTIQAPSTYLYFNEGNWDHN